MMISGQLSMAIYRGVAANVPSLNLDFTNSAASLSSLITFSRASSATYFDSTGTLQTASSGVARAHAFQDHDPSTLTPLGFLIEEQRTNSLRNNTMQGAVAGTPGTAPTNWQITAAGGSLTSVTIVGTGTENGIEYIDVRFIASGATSPQVIFEQNTQIAANNGETWSGSQFVKLAGGSLTNVAVSNRVQFRVAAGSNASFQDVAIVPTSASLSTQRSINTFTATNALTASITGACLIAFSGAGDVTLRIGLPQLEQGAFATSVIKTTSAAATRLADSALIDGTAFAQIYNSAQMTYFVEYLRTQALSTSATARALCVSDSTNETTNGDLIQGVNSAGGFVSANTFAATANQGRLDSAVAFVGATRRRAAYSVIAGRRALSVNGGTAVTSVTSTRPTGVDRLIIGAGGPGGAVNHINGTISRIALYRTALTDATIQGLTA